MMRVLVGKLETDPKLKDKFPFKYIQGEHGESHEVSVALKPENLTPGTYYVMIEVDWKFSQFTDFVMASYASIDVGLKEIPKNSVMNFLDYTLKSCALQKTKREVYSSANLAGKAFKCMALDDSNIHYGYIYV